MYYKYWRNWLLTLLLRLVLAAAVSTMGMALFLGGISQKNAVPLILGLIINICALMVIMNVVRTILVPWKGGGGDDFPFYMQEWESYETYKKRMGSGK